MKYQYIVSLLICALLASSTLADEQSTSNTIKIGLYEGSNSHWIAINVQDGSMDTTAVQMRDSAEGAAWTDMQLVMGWNHWVVNSPSEYTFPLSFRITSKAEQEIVVDNIISALGEDIIDLGVQYSAPHAARRKSSHGRPTQRPPTAAPTKAPSTKAPVAPTKAPSTKAPVAPTKAPSTKAPVAPTTAPTKAPVSTKAPVAPTAAPTKAATPTTAPISTKGGMGLVVPLYSDPFEGTWDVVLASASKVRTLAIINPNDGPANGPDSSYKTYMKKFQNAGVEMIGYVYTLYGTRNINDVKADIAKYASEFPEVIGIFQDEVAAGADKVAYYTELHQYIMSFPGWKYNMLNPGAVPVQAYYSISTQLVSYESATTKFANSANPSYANAANKDHFAVIAYSATQTQMVAAVASAKSKGYYGWAYFTDNTNLASTYNNLATYYALMATTIVA